MMFLKELMKKKKMTRAELSRESGIPESTLRDILNGTSRIERCEALTLALIAEVLDTTVEEILQRALAEQLNENEAESGQDEEMTLLQNEPLHVFYTFMDTLQEMLAAGSDIDLCLFAKEHQWVEDFFAGESYSIALFLVGFSDYVCRKYKVTPFREYEKYRHMRLTSPVYPLALFDPEATTFEYEAEKDRLHTFAVPELGRLNIFMTEKDLCRKV